MNWVVQNIGRTMFRMLCLLRRKKVSMGDVPIAYAKLGVTFVARTN